MLFFNYTILLILKKMFFGSAGYATFWYFFLEPVIRASLPLVVGIGPVLHRRALLPYNIFRPRRLFSLDKNDDWIFFWILDTIRRVRSHFYKR